MAAKPPIGLYFTDKLIEVSQLTSDGKKLSRFNSLPLPEGIVVNGEVKDRQKLILSLRTLFSTAKPKSINSKQDVVIGVGDDRTFLRELTIPKFSGKEIEEAAEYQIKSLKQVLPSGVETDWQIIGQDSNDQVEVLLAALSRKIIDSYIDICSVVGLTVVAIEPAVYANARTIEPKLLEGKNILMVFVGDDFAVFSYITNSNPRFSNVVSESEVEKNGGIVKTTESYISFANSKHQSRRVQEIIVSGFNSQNEKLVAVYNSQKIPAILAQSRLLSNINTVKDPLHTSSGLCLKTIVENISPNLLPTDYRLAGIRFHYLSVWKGFLLLMIFGTIFGGFMVFSQLQQNQSKFKQLSEIKTQYQTRLSRSDATDLIDKTNQINELSNQLVALKNSTGGEERLLGVIANTTPIGIKLTSLSFYRGPESLKLNDKNGTWMITGTATSRPLVLDFYTKLLTHSEFITGQLYFSSLEKNAGVSFHIASPQRI